MFAFASFHRGGEKCSISMSTVLGSAHLDSIHEIKFSAGNFTCMCFPPMSFRRCKRQTSLLYYPRAPVSLTLCQNSNSGPASLCHEAQCPAQWVTGALLQPIPTPGRLETTLHMCNDRETHRKAQAKCPPGLTSLFADP